MNLCEIAVYICDDLKVFSTCVSYPSIRSLSSTQCTVLIINRFIATISVLLFVQSTRSLSSTLCTVLIINRFITTIDVLRFVLIILHPIKWVLGLTFFIIVIYFIPVLCMPLLSHLIRHHSPHFLSIR
ncbi:hypothetical protein AMTRI_Chr05g58240 [Amborella trichopoda]